MTRRPHCNGRHLHLATTGPAIPEIAPRAWYPPITTAAAARRGELAARVLQVLEHHHGEMNLLRLRIRTGYGAPERRDQFHRALMLADWLGLGITLHRATGAGITGERSILVRLRQDAAAREEQAA